MKRIYQTALYAIISLIGINGVAQQTIMLDTPQAENSDNRALYQVLLSPNGEEGYDFVPTDLIGDIMNPWMDARIDFSIVGAMQSTSTSVFSASDLDTSIDTSKPVRNLTGTASVSPSGGATYTVPIVIPKGTAGMAPSLSLNYNSQGGSGLLGMGWNLAASSAILRVPKNRYNDGSVEGVELNTNDVFALDGNRLIVIFGNYGEINSVYATEAETFSRTTLMELDGNGNPAWFKVETKEGKTLEYGKSSSAKQVLGGVINTWMLYRVIDNYGNYIEYQYLTEDHQTRLDEIIYTGNESEGLDPYNRIQFHYIERADKNTRYMNGYKVNTNILLDFIDIRYQDDLFKKYKFNYGFNDLSSYLNEVIEIGANGAELNPLKFQYDQCEISINNQMVTSPVIESIDPNEKSDYLYGDFNGDGKTDYVSLPVNSDIWNTDMNTSWYYHENKGSDLFVIGAYGLLDNVDTGDNGDSFHFNTVLSKFNNNTVGDYNGDGRDDFVVVKLKKYNTNNGHNYFISEIKVFLAFVNESNEVYFDEIVYDYTYTYQGIATNQVYRDLQKFIWFGDFDGNGATDILTVSGFGSIGGSSHVVNSIVFSPSTGSIKSNIDTNSSPLEIDFGRVGDYNGDGISDFYKFYENSLYIYAFNSLSPNIFEWSLEWYTNYIDYTNLQFGDFNGDQKTDIFTYNNNIINIKYSTGSVENSTGFISKSQNIGPKDYVYVIDLNSDGKSDIFCLKGYTVWPGCTSNLINEDIGCAYESTAWYYKKIMQDAIYFDLYLSKGFNDDLNYIDNFVHIASNYALEEYVSDLWALDGNPPPTCETVLSNNTGGNLNCTMDVIDNQPTSGWGYQKFSISKVTDFNGDGYVEIGINNLNLSLFDGYSREPLSKIKDSFGNITEFDYEPLTNNDIYTKGTNASGALQDIQPALFVVTEVKTKNPIGGNNITNYKYQEALIHKEGRGFLGFMKTYVQNFSTLGEHGNGIMSITTSNIDPIWLVPFVSNQKSYYVPNPIVNPFELGNQISELNNYLNYIAINAYQYRTEMDYTTESVYFDGQETENTITEFTTDNNGNITYVEKNLNNGLSINTSTFNYGSFGNSFGIPNKLISNTKTVKRNSENIISTTETFDYNTEGSLTEKIEFSGTVRAITIDVATYNNFGLPTSLVVCAPNTETRNTSMVYDETNRFVIETINPLNQESSTTYHPVWGLPLTTNDITGQTTTFQYNEWGRMTSSTQPNGVTSSNTIDWLTSNPNWGSTTAFSTDDECYRTSTTTDGAPMVVKVYNRFGMELKSTVDSHFGDHASKIITYNNKGQVISTTEPHFEGNPNGKTILQYDEWDRISNSTYSSGSVSLMTSFSYLWSGNNRWETTITKPDGTTTKQYRDPVGLITKVIDENDNTLTYDFFSDNNPKYVWIASSGLAASMTYDEWGNQITLYDHNAGTTTYEYDAYRQLTKQIDGQGHEYQMEYDILGRLTSKTSIIPGQVDEVYSYTYIQDGNGLNALERETAPNGYYTEYEYGGYNRVMSITENIDNIDYTTSLEYNNNGSVSRKINPGGFATRNTYTSEGYLDAITTDDYATTIWRPETQNAKGVYTKFVLGNGQETTKTYDNLGMPTSILTVDGADNYIQDLDMDWDGTSFNLLSRTDNLKDLTENFTYDINRLASAQVTDMQTSMSLPFLDMAYLDNGNIDTKTGIGQYDYYNVKPHQILTSENTNHLISASPQNITYTDFNSMEVISDSGGIKTLTLGYGADQQRRKQVFENNGSVVSTKYYAGSYEKIITAEVLEDGQVVIPAMEREVSYISSGTGLCAMWVVENGFGNIHYLHKDHLGSIVVVTDDGGSVVFEQNFDAWGRYRDPNTWEYFNNGLAEDFALADDNIADWVSEIADVNWSWFRRGYTGHEMLPEFGLINMNGRSYDPILGRMLQVDNYVQNPYNSQSYNRYSYVLNNPLKYVDPSGEIWHIVIGAAIGGIINVATHWNQIDDFGDGLAAFTIGAIAGGVGAATFGAGFAAAGGTVLGASVLTGTVVAGSGGFVAGAAGGMAAAAISSPIISAGNSAYFGDPNLTLKQYATGILISGLTGGIINGTVSAINGNNFWNGDNVSRGRNIFSGRNTPKYSPEYDYPNPNYSNWTEGGNAQSGEIDRVINPKTISETLDNFSIHARSENPISVDGVNYYLDKMKTPGYEIPGGAGFIDGSNAYITDGHHRAVAATIHGMQTGDYSYLQQLINNGNFYHASGSDYGYTFSKFPVIWQ